MIPAFDEGFLKFVAVLAVIGFAVSAVACIGAIALVVYACATTLWGLM